MASKRKNVSIEAKNTEINIQRQTRLYQTSYISKYFLWSLGLRYIRVLLYFNSVVKIYCSLLWRISHTPLVVGEPTPYPHMTNHLF